MTMPFTKIPMTRERWLMCIIAYIDAFIDYEITTDTLTRRLADVMFVNRTEFSSYELNEDVKELEYCLYRFIDRSNSRGELIKLIISLYHHPREAVMNIPRKGIAAVTAEADFDIFLKTIPSLPAYYERNTFVFEGDTGNQNNEVSK